MNQLSSDLTRLGAVLETVASADLRRRRRRSRRLVATAIVLVLLVPAASFAAARLIGNEQVAASMPAGAAIFAGRHPTCTAVRQDVEYHCVLDRPPYHEVDDFKGTVEATVDASKHVNGGCRSLQSDGLVWQCYLGQKAVDEQIVDEGFLGQYAPSPGHG